MERAPGAPCAGGLDSGDGRIGLRAALALQRQLVALRTELVFARQVAVNRADGERGRDGDVGQAEVLQRTPHQAAAGLGIRQALTQVEVQHRAAGVQAL